MSATFTSDYIIIRAHESVKAVDLSIPGAQLGNLSTSASPFSGVCSQIMVHYKDSSPSSTYILNKDVKFPEDTNVLITMGGKTENKLMTTSLEKDEEVTWHRHNAS
ncbi:hypothetical protein FLAG1_11019 [Fusarium langsethiae]|uniref:Uncharacterized protein n=1 Tax=Fusarium langsethiae TaxID=179993 RepID=A0A0M9EMR6_FUSLA|nr:hypothetical protein FLAG1_11019 [Fusarium langsethiae]